MSQHKTTRRDFLRASSAAGAAVFLSGGSVWAAARRGRPKRVAPSDRLNIGIIGAGGQGAGNLRNVSSENIVALCDVDDERAAESYSAYPDARRYHDFRQMIDEAQDLGLDAVVVSTPDHNHACASIRAMRAGLHVYCEKPLTHDIWEARQMRLVAEETGVATSMGNQGTSHDGLRRAVEVIRAGAIGPVREVHVWTNRPGDYWPQGLDRPTDMPPIPEHVHWNEFLGTAPERPYHPAYHPFAWRGWWDFGTGALGDMACHTMNMPYMALELGHPSAVEAESSGTNGESYPSWSIIRIEVPERGDSPPVTITWYDGGRRPTADMVGIDEVPSSGAVLVGERGKLFTPDDYGADFRLLPASDFEGYEGPEPTLPRSPGHHAEWLRACKGGEPAMASFAYAGPLTEAVLIGNVALRVPGRLEWDGENLQFTNNEEANQYVRREYRAGWEI